MDGLVTPYWCRSRGYMLYHCELFWVSSYFTDLDLGTLLIQAGLVGHFTLAPSGTPTDQLTPRNKRGGKSQMVFGAWLDWLTIIEGDTLIAFAVLHVFSFSMFWGPTPWVYLGKSNTLALTLDLYFISMPLGKSFPLRVRPKAIALGRWVAAR